MRSKGPSCEKWRSERCKNSTVVFVTVIENQFQPGEGRKFSNPLDYCSFESRFIHAGLFLYAPALTAARGGAPPTHHTNLIFPRMLSCPLKEERIRLDGTFDITVSSGGVIGALCFSLKGYFRTTFREVFLVQISTWIST